MAYRATATMAYRKVIANDTHNSSWQQQHDERQHKKQNMDNNKNMWSNKGCAVRSQTQAT
jgi:hypothetical protein